LFFPKFWRVFSRVQSLLLDLHLLLPPSRLPVARAHHRINRAQRAAFVFFIPRNFTKAVHVIPPDRQVVPDVRYAVLRYDHFEFVEALRGGVRNPLELVLDIVLGVVLVDGAATITAPSKT